MQVIISGERARNGRRQDVFRLWTSAHLFSFVLSYPIHANTRLANLRSRACIGWPVVGFFGHMHYNIGPYDVWIDRCFCLCLGLKKTKYVSVYRSFSFKPIFWVIFCFILRLLYRFIAWKSSFIIRLSKFFRNNAGNSRAFSRNINNFLSERWCDCSNVLFRVGDER